MKNIIIINCIRTYIVQHAYFLTTIFAHPTVKFCMVSGNVINHCLYKLTSKVFIETILFCFSIALAEYVPEPQIDIISSLCGSSVAWFYMMIEAASDGAVKVGLPRKVATELAARAMVGAGNMVLKTGKHPGEVRSSFSLLILVS